MSIAKVEDIAYVRFRAPDLDLMYQFGLDFGFAPALRTSETLYFRGTSSAPYLHVTTRGEAGFDGFAFRATADEVRALSSSDGVPVEEIKVPGGGVGIRLVDPDGNGVEVVANQEPASALIVPPRDGTNDVTRRDGRSRTPKRLGEGPAHVVRLGHCVVAVSDFRRSEAWYKERFGLITSDEIIDHDGMFGEKGKTIGAFMRCDRGSGLTDHHSLFLLGNGKPAFHHAAFEVLDLDDLMVGHHYLKTRERHAEWGVGRHLLGSQIFDYWKDPWGHTVEHWTDGDRFDVSNGSRTATVPELFAVQWGPAVTPEAR